MAEKQSTAQKWIEKIDEPLSKGYEDINHNAVEDMQDDAIEVLDEEPRIFIFEDGSSVYEKRRNDWYAFDFYVKCASCNGWEVEDEYEHDDAICNDCIQSEADDEEATAIVKSEVSD